MTSRAEMCETGQQMVNMMFRAYTLVSLTVVFISAAAAGCTPGEQACPVVLKMKRGATSITAEGTVSLKHPIFYFTFEAREGQNLTIHIVGGGVKTGAGYPISGPDGVSDGVTENDPYKLPKTGAYVFEVHANTMASTPSEHLGSFRMTMTIQ